MFRQCVLQVNLVLFFPGMCTWYIFARQIRISVFGKTKNNSSTSEHAKHGPIVRVSHDATRPITPFYVFWNQRQKLPNQCNIARTWIALLFPSSRGMNWKSLVGSSKIVLSTFSTRHGRTYIHVVFCADYEYRIGINLFLEEHGQTGWQSWPNWQNVESSNSRPTTTITSYISGFYVKNGLTNVTLSSLENIFWRTWFWASKPFRDRKIPSRLGHDLTQSISQRFSGRGIRIWPQPRWILIGTLRIWGLKIFSRPIQLQVCPSCSPWKINKVWCLACASCYFFCKEHGRTLVWQKFFGRTWVFFQRICPRNTTFLKFCLSLNFIVFIDRGRKKQQSVKAVSNVLFDYNNMIPCFRRSSLSNWTTAAKWCLLKKQPVLLRGNTCWEEQVTQSELAFYLRTIIQTSFNKSRA